LNIICAFIESISINFNVNLNIIMLKIKPEQIEYHMFSNLKMNWPCSSYEFSVQIQLEPI
jgi:hypothetical protein